MQGASCSGAWQLTVLPALACFDSLRSSQLPLCSLLQVNAESISNRLRSGNASGSK